MRLGSLSFFVATAIFALSSLAGASANSSQLVVVTNTSAVCQRFDAIGTREEWDPHSRRFELKTVPPYIQLDAAPGATVTFDRLSESGAVVWANSHVAAGCASAMSGRGNGPYGTRGRVHLSFDGTHFKRVATL
ncbi:MAG: hypothetical protein KGN02_05720 [bacterium]|nr:hypothetical protein [bacterium]